MPPFVLGVEEAEGFGDFGSRSGPLPVAAGLAWPIRDGLAGAGFDVALSYALTVDHGVVQSYDMICGAGAAASGPAGSGAARGQRRHPAGAAGRQHRRAAAAEHGALRGARAGARGRDPRRRIRRPGAADRQRRPLALAAVQRPARRLGRGRAAGVRHPRAQGRPRLRGRPRARGAGDGRGPERPRQPRMGRLVPQAAGRRGPGAGRRARRRGPGGERGPGRARDPHLAGGAGRRGRARWCGPATRRCRSGSRAWASARPSR